MKHACALLLLVSTPLYANDLILTFYDSTFYSEKDPAYANTGDVTGISDEYYYFKPLDKTLTVSHTEWLSDGDGGEYMAPYNPAEFSYTEVTFDNFLTRFPWLSGLSDFTDNVFPQWKKDFDEYVQSQLQLLTAPLIQTTQQLSKINRTQNRQFFNIAHRHENTKIGRNGGDENTGLSVWGQALYSHGKQHGENAFSANMLGVVFGGEIEVIKSLNLGIGFGYNNTDSNLNHNTITANNNTIFLYADYDIKNFFIKGLFAYNFGDYEYSDTTYKGDITGYFASAIFGATTKYNFSPEIGIQYNNVKIKDKSSFLTTEQSNVYSAVAGIEYNNTINRFDFGGTLLLNYDFYKPNSDIKIHILNQTFHTNQKNADKPLGIEIGIWTGYNISNIKLQMEYDLFLQSDYTNHTGRLSFRYTF